MYRHHSRCLTTPYQCLAAGCIVTRPLSSLFVIAIFRLSGSRSLAAQPWNKRQQAEAGYQHHPRGWLWNGQGRIIRIPDSEFAIMVQHRPCITVRNIHAVIAQVEIRAGIVSAAHLSQGLARSEEHTSELQS